MAVRPTDVLRELDKLPTDRWRNKPTKIRKLIHAKRNEWCHKQDCSTALYYVADNYNDPKEAAIRLNELGNMFADQVEQDDQINEIRNWLWKD